MDWEFLQTLKEEWKPVSKPVLYAWLVFLTLFLIYAARHRGPGLFIDLVFVPIHEGGHVVFGMFGQTMEVAGGTLMQLCVPLAFAIYFFFQRHITGVAFATFFFFENFLQVATYMADARAQKLPLVTLGSSGDVIHDWFYMFNGLGVLEHDTQIAAVVRVLGWVGMITVPLWLLWKGKELDPKAPRPPWLRKRRC
jgi:hypothetical protein